MVLFSECEAESMQCSALEPEASAAAGESAENSVTRIHHDIGGLLIAIDRWESAHGPYERARDETRLDLRLKSLFDRLCRAPARSQAEVLNKLERAIHVGGRGTPLGDRLIQGALDDLRRIRVREKFSPN